MVRCFWYTWFHFWSPNSFDDMDALVDDIAENFVHLLMHIQGKDKDEFFQIYPNIIAQAIHSCFVTCFPSSRSLLGMDFKHGLCDLIYHMLSGIHPSKLACEQWPKGTLDTSENRYISTLGREKDRRESEPAVFQLI